MLNARLTSSASVALVAAAAMSFAQPPVDLADIAAGNGGFVVNGVEEQMRLGHSVSDAGDVNGDGLADFIVGAPNVSPSGVNLAGESYVVFGRTGTTPLSIADVRDGKGGFAISGASNLESSGWGVSGAGDVNGDGLDDVIVGAPHDSTSAMFAGSSYVVFGKADTQPVYATDIAAGKGGFAIHGAHEFSSAGSTVSGAGDVNGDGLADLLVGAPDAIGLAAGQLGVSYVVFGKADTAPVQLSNVFASAGGGFAILGNETMIGCCDGPVVEADGLRVGAGSGDINGDGFDDLIIGTYLASFDGINAAGATYVIFGKADFALVDLADVDNGSGGGFAIYGAGPDDGAGFSSANAGDVNGDGLDDVILGAPDTDKPPPDAGQSYVVFGKAGTTAVKLADIIAGVGGFVIDGAGPNAALGWDVNAAGDINQDGLDDVIVSAPSADPEGVVNTGRSYVVFGKALGYR